MCLYMLGWKVARGELLKHYYKDSLHHMRLLDRPRSSLHSMPTKVALADLFEITAKVHQETSVSPLMSGGHDAYYKAAGQRAEKNTTNKCGVAHRFNLLSVLQQHVAKYIEFFVDVATCCYNHRIDCL